MNKDQVIAHIKATPQVIPEGQRYVLERLGEQDALGVARLFYTVYDENYPIEDYYIPERLLAKNATHDLISLVARLPGGEVVAHAALFRSSSPNPGFYEIGLLLIVPAYRGGRLTLVLNDQLDKLAAQTPHVQAAFGESVTNHLVTQKLGERFHYVECGIELGLMPDGAYAGEGAALTRVSCVQSVKVLRDSAQSLWLPEIYRETLCPLLDDFQLQRTPHFCAEDQPIAEASVVDFTVFDLAKVMRVNIKTIGRDIITKINELDELSRQKGLSLTQIYLSTGGAGIATATRHLREQGYFFGGFLPLWFGHDALFMQKLHHECELGTILLFTDKAKNLLDFIHRDREAVRIEAARHA